MEEDFAFLKAISECRQAKMMFGNSKQRLNKVESCQTNLVTFHDKISVDERRAMDVACFSYSRTFLMVSYSTPMSKLGC